MMGGQTPILILKEGTKRDTGKNAINNNIAAAKAVADAVRSTLGPKGMDKMLVDSMGDVVITNDGATILKEIDVEHPVAKMIVEVAKAQDDECGDGTTSAVVMAGELLKKTEELLDLGVHATIIANGYKLASEEAIKALKKSAIKVKPTDKKTLKKVAVTAMTGKSAGSASEHLADVAVNAVSAIAEKTNDGYEADIDNIQIEKKHGGAVTDTKMIEGIIIDKERVHKGMPKVVKNAKIALVDSALEVKKTEVDAKISIRDPAQLQAFLAEEENMLRNMVQKVKKSGANVLLCQKGIDDLAQHYLAKEGIYAIRRVKKSDMEKLAKATGGRIVSNLDDLSKKDLGHAGLVEEKKIGDDEMTFVTECKNPKAVSILIRGGTEHVVEQVDRGLHDALSVVAVAIEDGLIVTGGGSTEMEVTLALQKFSGKMKGREQLAIKAFADAIEIIPRTLAENGGLDPINMVVDLRTEHEKGKKYMGIDTNNEKISDMLKGNVVEPLRVKEQAIRSATEAAVMILRIDDVIASKGMETPSPPGGAGGGPGGGPGGGYGGEGMEY